MAQNLGNLFIDGEGTINDGSGSDHIITTHGGAEVSTIDKVFGNSSVRFYRNDYIYVENNTDFDVVGSTTVDYTIDFWAKNEGTITGRNQYMYNLENGNNCWFVTGQASKPGFIVRIADVTVLEVVTPDAIDAYVWHHIAIVKSGTTFTVFIDGINKASETFSTTDTFSAILAIGNRQDLDNWSPFVGYMDNIRFTKGTALWTSNFDLTEEALFYTGTEENPYVRPDKITKFYSASSQGNLRGKAAEGFIRPTIKQFFAPYKMKFEEIESAPVLTGYTIDKCEGGTATASSSRLGRTADFAFANDGQEVGAHIDQDHEWEADGENGWIKYDFGVANEQQIEKVSMVGNMWWSPTAFTIEGSNDDTNWDVLETVSGLTGEDWSVDGQISLIEFEFSNTVAYRYIIIRITESVGGTFMGLNEIEMMEGIYE